MWQLGAVGVRVAEFGVRVVWEGSYVCLGFRV